ncbi:hypothetical protein GJU43_19910 [Flavobacterium sp. LC2016-23]|uniref:hypothetical protein n=1 Tax=Flavobacterium sp. LC2016-23 TaxID=2666330 RepID=UPI0012AF6519|nr:hypothetical protein [Flavobacterium sp. LC2016-23]MRX41555.1 hypothetical protein [Flavobacterium sp. LC2016-23]
MLNNILLFVLFYSILQISSTFEPLEEYNYSVSKLNLEKSLRTLRLSDSRIVYQITDTTGSKEYGYKYYVTLLFKKSSIQNFEYNLNYEEQTVFWKNSNTLKLNLVGAFDKSKNTGGYQKSDEDVPKLIEIFETDILPKIKKQTSH